MVTATAENRGMTYFSCAIMILCQFSCKHILGDLFSPSYAQENVLEKDSHWKFTKKNKIFKAMLQYKLHVLCSNPQGLLTGVCN